MLSLILEFLCNHQPDGTAIAEQFCGKVGADFGVAVGQPWFCNTVHVLDSTTPQAIWRVVVEISLQDDALLNDFETKLHNYASFRVIKRNCNKQQVYTTVTATLAEKPFVWFKQSGLQGNFVSYIGTETGVKMCLNAQSLTFKGNMTQISFVQELTEGILRNHLHCNPQNLLLQTYATSTEVYDEVTGVISTKNITDRDTLLAKIKEAGVTADLKTHNESICISGYLKQLLSSESVVSNIVKDLQHKQQWTKEADVMVHFGSEKLGENTEKLAQCPANNFEPFDRDVFSYLMKQKKKDIEDRLGQSFEKAVFVRGFTDDQHYVLLEANAPDKKRAQSVMQIINEFFIPISGKTESEIFRVEEGDWPAFECNLWLADDRKQSFVLRVMKPGLVKVTAEYIQQALLEVKSLIGQRSLAATRYSPSEPLLNSSLNAPHPTQQRPIDKLKASLPVQQITIGKLKVQIYQEDITRIRVDAIVNAANEDLQHGGGVALAIAKAAGRRFEDEGHSYIRQHGQLGIGEVYSQKAGGSLLQNGVKYVLHVVGPRMSGDEHKCEENLAQAISNVLLEAEHQQLQTVTIPAISSGIFGVPMDICCRAYWSGLMDFILEETCWFIKEVHFVNIDEATTSKIQTAFMGWSEVLSIGSPNMAQNDSSAVDESTEQRRSVKASSQTTNTDVNRTKQSAMADLSFGISSHHHDTDKKNTAAAVASAIVPNTNWGYAGVTSAGMTASTKEFAKGTSSSHTADNASSSGTSSTPDSSSSVLSASIKSFSTNTPSSGTMPVGTAPVGTASARRASTSMLSTEDATNAKSCAHDWNSMGFSANDLASSVSEPAKANTLDECTICLQPFSRPKVLPCNHKFCADCIAKHSYHSNPLCPTCRKPYGEVKGNQPPGGSMTTSTLQSSLPGYEGCGTMQIDYFIPSGTQMQSHPHPGRFYHRINKTAYLPNNTEGKEALAMLRKAFDAGLIFTIGRSGTNADEDVLVWNDIRHKTSRSSQSDGYPDPGYLQRLKEDLAAQGITP